MIADCKRLLAAKSAEWGLPGGAEWQFLFHNNYQPGCSTINLLWFDGQGRFPRVVTKLCARRDVLAREFHSLEAVHRAAPRNVPRPLELGEAQGLAALWMEGVPGRRIPPNADGREALANTVEILASMHRRLKQDRAPDTAKRHEAMVAAPIRAVLEYAPSVAVRDGCMTLRERANPAWLERVPVIPQHGDLYLDNVLQHGKDCHIVDWEEFGRLDLPFHDLLTLLLSSLRASAAAPERWPAELRTRIPGLVAKYAVAAGLPTAAVRIMLPLTLANSFSFHRREGHAAAKVMYAELEHYFRAMDYWEEVFLPATESARASQGR